MKKTKKEMFIGIGLGRLRNERGWTQEKLAQESELNTRFIQDLEYNDSSPSGTTLSLLANAFEMRPWEFLKNIDDEIIYKFPEKKGAKKTAQVINHLLIIEFIRQLLIKQINSC